MLGRSRAAHRSAAPATATGGTGTAGGDPAAGTGDGALSTPAAMVAAAVDLPVRTLWANSSPTLSCPAGRSSAGLLNVPSYPIIALPSIGARGTYRRHICYAVRRDFGGCENCRAVL
jgi:hypothetical protein